MQVVVNNQDFAESELKRLYTGTCISVTGKVAESLGKGQYVEIIASQLEILGDCDPNDFPIQMKKTSLEFLREKAHLRFRTNTFGAVFRLRHHLAYAVHQFFNERGFFYLHSPILS